MLNRWYNTKIMVNITIDKTREIIDDFAQVISERKSSGTKPQKTVIDFRQDRQNGIEREIVLVPLELLRFRKDNGRIASDVYSYEKNHGPLDEKDNEAQVLLAKFLSEKDPEKTKELRNSIIHSHQEQPAIITADGFLINGNRRKMVLQQLHKDFPGNGEYSTMKVVILPGKGEEGGPPTVKEIEQIENRYQLQSDGKAEYYSFDKAISIKRKIELGMSLEEQLADDPNFVGLSKKELNKVIEDYKNKYLEPLNCIDQYLDQLGRTGLYDTISTGISDREGRWQAFLDYYTHVHKKLKDENKRIDIGIAEDEIGKIQDVSFKLIRKREFSFSGNSTKVHELMRKMPKILANEEAKKELLKIAELSDKLPESETIDSEGNELKPDVIDKKWVTANQTELMKNLNLALKHVQEKNEEDTPLNLLEVAYKKLCHDNLIPTKINKSDLGKAMKMLRQIKTKAKEIEDELYDISKGKVK